MSIVFFSVSCCQIRIFYISLRKFYGSNIINNYKIESILHNDVATFSLFCSISVFVICSTKIGLNECVCTSTCYTDRVLRRMKMKM